MRVRCLQTGRVRPKRAPRGPRRYLPGAWSDDTLPVNAFVVEHPAGVCLFDAGQSARAARPGYLPRWHPFHGLSRFELESGDEAGAQVDPEGVRWVALSHLHTDHVGGLAPFTRSEVLVSRVEWDRAQGLAGRLRGYFPQYWPEGLEPHLIDFRGPPVGPFPVSHDVAGDGVLLLVPTPGHTLGHMAMLILGGERRYLLGGDLAHSTEGLANAVSDYCRQHGVAYLGAHDDRAHSLCAAPA